jgi:hypothetical protein
MKNSVTEKRAKRRGFSAEARKWRRDLLASYEIERGDAAARILIEMAMSSLDEARAAEQLIEKHGQLMPDRFGQLKTNPAVLVLRDSRLSLMRAIRLLNLDVEPPNAIGRPPGR